MNKPTPEKEAPPAEYTALNFDGTERRGNYRTVAYRIDILHICEHKDAAAILFEIIYRWQTEVRKPDILKEIERRKKAGQPPLTEEEVDSMMWVWMSYNDFVRECGGAIGYNTVIRMLDYLVETAQLIECRENHDPRYPDYEYRIRMDVLKEKLKALPAAPAFLPKVPKKKENKGDDSTQMGTPQKRSTQKGRRAQKSTQVGIVSTQMGTPTTQVGREVYPNGGTSHTYSHTSHIEHTEGTDGADRATPAPVTSHSPTEEHDDDTSNNNPTGSTAHGNTRHPAHDLGMQTTTSEVAGSGGYEKDDDTQKRAAVRPAQQLSTGAGTSPQQSAKVERRSPAPARPAQSGRGKGKQQEYKVFWTTEGALFRGWYEELTGVKIDETAANARACNSLASRASVTYDNLKLVVNEIRNNAWVKRERVGVTVQDLASDDKNLRWEKWLTAAQMAAQSAADEQAKRSASTSAPTVSGLPRWTPPAYVN